MYMYVSQVPQQTKLPSLYLLDSIVKNVGGEYLHLVAQVMEKSFTCVFEKVRTILSFTYFGDTLTVKQAF